MPNYANGKVYKLISSVDGKIYIGSTTVSLSTRLANHKAIAKKNPSPVHKHLNNIGWDTVRIVLIETVTCINKEQLIQREQHYIDLLKPSLNKHHAYAHCPHGRKHQLCVECHGVGICIHNKQKSKCKECCGNEICIHNKQKTYCKECGGSGICPHNKQKAQCKICGGTQICEHNIRKPTCKICSPKHCEYCNITICKSNYKQHTTTKKHIYNFIHS